MKIITIDELKSHTEQWLRKCNETGESIIVTIGDTRIAVIEPYLEEDSLIDDLIRENAEFREYLHKSVSSRRHPFKPLALDDSSPNISSSE